jgi:hypothetical protein
VSSASNIIRVIKSRRIRWEFHVASWGGENAYKILVKNLNERDHLRGIGIEGRIILK